VRASAISAKPRIVAAREGDRAAVARGARRHAPVYWSELGDFEATPVFWGERLAPGNVVPGRRSSRCRTRRSSCTRSRRRGIDPYGNVLIDLARPLTMIGKQAIVVGAGMGGLTAAQALAAHFERVTVLDADVLPDDTHEPRAACRRASTSTFLLAGGLRALGALFPGFEGDLARAGAVPMRIGARHPRGDAGAQSLPQRDLGILGYAMSAAPGGADGAPPGPIQSPPSRSASAAACRSCCRTRAAPPSPACATKMPTGRSRRRPPLSSWTRPDAGP
jgi:hypothetical protein